MARALLVIAAGALLAFGFAPYGFYPLAFISLAVLFYLTRGVTPRRAAFLGWCYGVGMFGHGVWWIQVSIHQFGLPLYSFSVTTTALFALFLALYPAIAIYVACRLTLPNSLSRTLLAMPLLWVLVEWIRGWFLSGFPWLELGYSQTDSWLAGFAPVFGALGVSMAVAVVAGALVVVVTGARREKILSALCVALICVAGNLLRSHEWTRPSGQTLSVALVQGAIPQTVKWQAQYRAVTFELYQALSEAHWGKSVIIWPETAIPAFPEEVQNELAALTARAVTTNTTLLVGAPTGDRRVGPYYNSVMLLDGTGQHYDKHHLVPFGEYLPFDQWVRPVLNFLAIPMSDFAPGKHKQAGLVSGGAEYGVTICYEDAYASEVIKALPQANILVNVSDDAWFGDSIAPHQHLQITRMRALEAGRAFLRATNTGISAVIDHHGRVTARSPQFREFVLTGVAELRTGATPFVRFKNYPMLIGIALGLVLVRFNATRQRV